jgi:hypothetical protein
MKTTLTAAALGIVMAAAAAVAAEAAEVKVSGSATYVITQSTATELAGGSTLTHFLQEGVIRTDDRASPFNLNLHNCAGSLITSADGATFTAMGSCDGIDKDGDVWWIAFVNADRNGGHWEVLGGTGKFAGMTGSGTTVDDLRTPDGRSSVSFEGSVTLK